jgi:hypothetical protein
MFDQRKMFGRNRQAQSIRLHFLPELISSTIWHPARTITPSSPTRTSLPGLIE